MSWGPFGWHAEQGLLSADASFWTVSVLLDSRLDAYVHGSWLYRGWRSVDVSVYRSRCYQASFSAPYTFGRLRAGGLVFSGPADVPCPACSSPEGATTAHLLRRCPASGTARSGWLRRLPAAAYRLASVESDPGFLRLVFDLSHDIGGECNAKIKFVASAVRAACERALQS